MSDGTHTHTHTHVRLQGRHIDEILSVFSLTLTYTHMQMFSERVTFMQIQLEL